MKYLSWFLVFVCLLAVSPATAQLLSPAPRCVTLVNQSGYTALGSVSTTRFVTPEGTSLYYRQNFRMENGKRNKFCSTGPFYPGYGLEVQLRSLIPLWTCIAPANGQEINVLSKQDEEAGTTRLSLDCPAL
ncbi:MAG: hypothetical protein V4621_02520 [Pseudomonadota bacterium]